MRVIFSPGPIGHGQIRRSVAKYFRWVMFSHTWEGKEPGCQDVNLVDSVWELDESPLSEKFHHFCQTSREEGYRWAWLGTCRIDKGRSASPLLPCTHEMRKQRRRLSTFQTSPTLPEPGDLTKSRRMSRAWTLQELLASNVIQSYNQEWGLYLSDDHVNHKESPAIKRELAQAVGVVPETITSFRPENLGVREKLRLASTRNASVKKDIAYSLIGVFSSDIVPRYGLGQTALDHLLEASLLALETQW